MPNRKPRKTTLAAQAAAAVMPQIPPELIDHLVTGPMSAEAVNAASYGVTPFWFDDWSHNHQIG